MNMTWSRALFGSRFIIIFFMKLNKTGTLDSVSLVSLRESRGIKLLLTIDKHFLRKS